MIKRSFFALSKPTLTYDLLNPDLADPEAIPIPGTLTLLLPEAIDSTKKALFAKGDSLKKGEKLKLYEDSTVYVLSPVAGTINALDSYSDDFGNTATYILVKPDPARTAPEDTAKITPKENIDFARDYLDHLPGALPFARLAAAGKSISTIVITGADADIISSTWQYTCTAYAREVEAGAQILKRMIRVPRICITIPEALTTQVNFGTLQVLKVSDIYPSALPAMIMKDHMDMVLPPGKTPEDMGVCFIRPEALVSLARVFKTQEPVFEKVITLVDKTGTQRRIKATMGTPLSKIFNRMSVHINEMDRIIIGGPMRGFATFTHHHPVTPEMDMVIVQDKEAIAELSDTPCVNCGKCIRICPVQIPVNLLVRYLEADQYEEAADQLDLESCIECGLCAYVCTARIPLYQYIRLGKHELLALRAEA